METALYLIPVTLGDTTIESVLIKKSFLVSAILSLKIFVRHVVF